MNATDYREGLERLAALRGIETAYRTTDGELREAGDEALAGILRSMGSPVEGPADVAQESARLRADRAGRMLSPAQVIWEGAETRVWVRLPRAGSGGDWLECRLEEEDGACHEWRVRFDDLEVSIRQEADRSTAALAELPLPATMGRGVHTLILTRPGPGSIRQSGRVIHAPPTVHGAQSRGGAPREWGLFIPLHALRTRDDWGVGDLTGLGRLRRWARARGARAVATLPLLAAFLDRDPDPSPYSPASRLFWNELYLDPTRAPGFTDCAEARDLVASDSFARRTDELRAGEQVDYEGVYTHKRRALEVLAAAAFERDGGAHGLHDFTTRNPEVVRYARFRSGFERHGTDWWDRTRGSLPDPDSAAPTLDESARYHLYVQWALERQLEGGAREGAADLYLDLPLGCHPRGFDPWRWPELFAEGATVGAPPDDLVREGQNWGFPPLDPEASRREGHRYWRQTLRTLLRPSGILRIDHVMALHRLFWIPRGMSASEGVYVRYPAEELYALLALESRSEECLVVGEDLGTVPESVREAMDGRGLLRMHVLPFELDPNEGARPVPAGVQASLNTHDMPTFAGFVEERDLARQRREAIRPPDEVEAEGKARRAALSALEDRLERERLLPTGAPGRTTALLRGSLRFLGASPARLVMVSLEDLWLEPCPQNIPGTGVEGGSWRRRARHSLDDFDDLPAVTEPLAELASLRPQGES